MLLVLFLIFLSWTCKNQWDLKLFIFTFSILLDLDFYTDLFKISKINSKYIFIFTHFNLEHLNIF